MGTGQISVLSVTEGRGLDARNNPVKTITVTYKVDNHGPFTETGTPQEFSSGVLKQRMQAFAQSVVANSQQQ